MDCGTGKILPIGALLDSGKAVYTIDSVISSGGFGVTYKAWTAVRLGNIEARIYVAIKQLCDSEAMERFVAGGERLRRIAGKSRNIVRVNEVFRAGGTAYCVMEYLDGISLTQYVRERGCLSVDETLAVTVPVVEAVAMLHGIKMTHLDIKPSNIMIVTDENGESRPVLIDFDESRHYSLVPALGTAGVSCCSEGYSPPEQYAGINGFSPTADVYSLGATIFYCLTGRRPPKSPDITSGYPSSVIGNLADMALAGTLDKAMSPLPDDRQKDADELYEELTDKTRPEPSLSPGKGLRPRLPEVIMTRSALKVMIGIVAPLFVIAMVVMTVSLLSDRRVSIDDVYPEDVLMDTVSKDEAVIPEVRNSVESTQEQPMQTHDFNGYFEADDGMRRPVRLRARTDGRGRWGECSFTDVTSGVTYEMSGSGKDGSVTFKSIGSASPLTITITRLDNGEWTGTAVDAASILRCVLYE